MPPSIRALAPGDHPAVVRLVTDVLAEHGFPASMGGLEADFRDLGGRYAGGRAGFWVAEDDGAIVGSVAVRPKPEGGGPSEGAGTCEIKRLYLRPDRRGAGLGQALYAHAEAFARAAGYTRIWLDSSRRFAKAHALYERNGFVLLEQLDNDWEDNVYEKRL
jgi:GNAT superfamily N-acetyltransferase